MLPYVEIKIVDFGTKLYEKMKTFRRATLRTPLGLHLSENDLAGEEKQIHIAAFDSNNVIVGTVLLKPLDDKYLVLRQMAVATSLQKLGLGRKLVRFAERVAADRKFTLIEMSARISAQEFYKKLGYAAVGHPYYEERVAIEGKHVAGQTHTRATIPAIKMQKSLAEL